MGRKSERTPISFGSRSEPRLKKLSRKVEKKGNETDSHPWFTTIQDLPGQFSGGKRGLSEVIRGACVLSLLAWSRSFYRDVGEPKTGIAGDLDRILADPFKFAIFSA